MQDGEEWKSVLTLDTRVKQKKAASLPQHLLFWSARCPHRSRDLLCCAGSRGVTLGAYNIFHGDHRPEARAVLRPASVGGGIFAWGGGACRARKFLAPSSRGRGHWRPPLFCVGGGALFLSLKILVATFARGPPRWLGA